VLPTSIPAARERDGSTPGSAVDAAAASHHHERHHYPRPDPLDPVAPAQRSQGADRKAASKTTTEHQPACSFTALLDHLATLTRVDLRYSNHEGAPIVPTLAEPTHPQRRAFELLDAPIPLTLK
jgi:hypothetical protein